MNARRVVARCVVAALALGPLAACGSDGGASAGGSADAGSTAAGSTAAGSTAVSTVGGSADAGSSAGGSAGAGSTEGGAGSTAGGSTTGPAPTAGAAVGDYPEFGGGDFYVPPASLPAGDGTLIWAQEVPAGAGMSAWRVLYRSTSVDGSPTAVSGLVVAPSGDAPATGGRAVLSVAHGTTGLGDSCAPSRALDDRAGTSALGAEFESLLSLLVASGTVVAVTDYEGLGTPGPHPYLVGESEARSVIDIVRAARQLPTGAGDRYAVWGHSQGGHAALFAGQVARAYAPELTLAGVAAGAPPSQMAALSGAMLAAGQGGYVAMVAAAYAAVYPGAELAAVMTPGAAVDAAALGETGCSKDFFARFDGVPWEDVGTGDPFSVEPWRSLLAANDPGAAAVAAPLLLLHGDADEVIPVATSEALWQQYCGLGVTVERRVYPGADHSGVVGRYALDVVLWLKARFDGVPAERACDG